jgi:hypothetical protein
MEGTSGVKFARSFHYPAGAPRSTQELVVLRMEYLPMNPKNHARAVRYRQLALAEPDRAKAAVLLTIADEAERDVLCTVDSTNLGYVRRGAAQNIPIQPK